MDCPVCHIKLQMSERQGIEIDYCPQCRGIWLDRGELDKLIERSQLEYCRHDSIPKDDSRRYDSHESYDKNYKKHKKRSFLGDFFDFD